MRRLAAVALAALLPLTACGGEGESGSATPAATATPEPESTVEPAPIEGPVGDGPHEWPDGVTAAVVSVTASPAAAPESPAEDTDVLVVVEFGNQGAETLSFGDSPNTIDAGPHVDLMYGANRTQAHGWYYDANNLPTQLTPGSTATWTASFSMPGAELGELVVTVSPDDAVTPDGHAPWTFTEVEALVD